MSSYSWTLRRLRQSPTTPGAGVSQNFEQAGRAHAATHAHRDHDMLHAAASAFDQSVADQARTAHSVGMADRDAAAVDIDAIGIDVETVAAIDHLYREGLVYLPQSDIVHCEPVPTQ